MYREETGKEGESDRERERDKRDCQVIGLNYEFHAAYGDPNLN